MNLFCQILQKHTASVTECVGNRRMKLKNTKIGFKRGMNLL